ncbi:hypothetical protein BLNAU_7757 [Blattamonas nauphoetae]|uniref:Uncharacterized protein n=1 Tax=Blattamonas nauphoetae TaxID=2049346 RepID=A0ABQ9Y106_9EUKA|nr:hypothetical protein BLNAU_7753 [Blattamonas nauphoetae]KAK2957379.1 hypothetical protein BLNAU_7757 [Blattamonas nauphoetae]
MSLSEEATRTPLIAKRRAVTAFALERSILTNLWKVGLLVFVNFRSNFIFCRIIRSVPKENPKDEKKSGSVMLGRFSISQNSSSSCCITIRHCSITVSERPAAACVRGGRRAGWILGNDRRILSRNSPTHPNGSIICPRYRSIPFRKGEGSTNSSPS